MLPTNDHYHQNCAISHLYVVEAITLSKLCQQVPPSYIRIKSKIAEQCRSAVKMLPISIFTILSIFLPDCERR